MSLFNTLDSMFPGHTHFYMVRLTDMSEALEKCARMTGEIANVFNYQGQIMLAVQHDLGDQISWLTPVPGNPVEVTAVDVTPATE